MLYPYAVAITNKLGFARGGAHLVLLFLSRAILDGLLPHPFDVGSRIFPAKHERLSLRGVFKIGVIKQVADTQKELFDGN